MAAGWIRPAAHRGAALLVHCLAFVLALGAPGLAAAQEVTGAVRIEVADTLGGALPGATVTLTPSGTGAAEPTVIYTDGSGAAEAVLPPGRYHVRIELPGFETAESELVIEAGRTVQHAAQLPIGGFAEQVTVTQDAVTQRLEDNFVETLSAEEIEALPDDPEEALQLLEQLAGPNPEIRVNGFEETELPPKSQIQAIRVRQDPFAADAHGAGRPRVEIITKPGMNRWEHRVDMGLRDQALDARNPFAPTRGEGQTRRLWLSSSGPIVPGRTSLSVNLFVRDAYDAQAIIAVMPDRTINQTANQQGQWINGGLRLEHALTPAQTLRVEYQRRSGERENLGVGEYSLPERAYDTTWGQHLVRISNLASFGASALNEARLELIWTESSRHSLSDAVAINVTNAFLGGGAQLGGGTREFELELGNDYEVAIGDKHRVRVGFETEFGRRRSDEIENATGRFTFPSLEAYEAGRPLQFVQRIGDPRVEYSRYEAGWYIYNQYRPIQSLQIGFGLRHELQSFVDHKANFAPRGSIAWTPESLPKTTLRAGAGVFYDWYESWLHEQTLRLDGVRQQEVIVSNPGWPDPFAGEDVLIETPPPSVIRAAEDLQLPRTRRISIGFEQPLAEGLDLRVNLFDESTAHRFRSLDVNAPVDGVRPDPTRARITEIRSIGEEEERGIDVSLRLRRGRSLFAMTRYRYAREMNDADGPLALPMDSSNLAAEWGPSAGDVRHRVFGYVRARLPYGLSAGLGARAQSGAPYTIRTGFDDNGDEVLNDRPAGVGRNTERGEWHVLSDLRLGWMVGGHPPDRDRGGRGREGRGQGGRDAGAEVYAQITNLFNTTNFIRYSGVMTSPLFGEPTAALPGRRMELGLRLFL